jgi:hypothetical protein
MSEREYLKNGIYQLGGQELRSLWDALHRGYLVLDQERGFLMTIHEMICNLSGRPGITVLAGQNPDWQLTVGVANPNQLGVIAQELVEAGAHLLLINKKSGVVTASVPADRADRVARALGGRRPWKGPMAESSGLIT